MKRIILLSLIVTALTAFAETTTQTVAIDEFRYQLTLTADNGNESSATATVLGFSNQGVAEAMIPASVQYEGQSYTVQTVASEAFKGNSTITSLTIPASVSNLNDYSLVDDCPNLTAIYVASGNSYFSSYNGALCNKTSTELYRIPEGITSYTFNAKLKTIGSHAARNCAITTVLLPYGITTIGEQAFYGCTNLVQIVVPGTITTIGTDAFAQCTALEHFYLNKKTNPIINPATLFTDVNTANVNLHVPADRITQYTQAGWTGFKTVNDQNVPAYDAEYPNNNNFRVNIVTDNAELILNDLFDGRAMIVKTYWNNTLSTFTVPDYVTINSKKYAIATIGDHAFEGCSNLTEVKLSMHLKGIAEEAFKNSGISGTLALPYGLNDIGANAFENTQLYRLVLPASVGAGTTYDPVHVQFLNGMTHLKDLVVNASTSRMLSAKQWNLSSLPADCRILVPMDYVSQYKSHSVWGQRSDYIQPGAYDFVTSNSYPSRTPQENYDDDSSFLHVVLISTQSTTYNNTSYRGTCRYVYHPSIAQNTNPPIRLFEVDRTCEGKHQLLVVEIGDSCFAGSPFTSLSLPKSVKKIGHHAFYNSQISGHIVVPSNIWSIGRDAFSWCGNLNSLTFEDRNVPFTEQIFGANDYSFEFIVPLDRINDYYTTMADWINYDNSPKPPRDHLVPYFSTDQSSRMFSTVVPVDFSSTYLDEAYIATGFNASTNTVTLEKVDKIPANTGVLLTGLQDYRTYVLHQPAEVPAAPSVNHFVAAAMEPVDVFTQEGGYYWNGDNNFVRPTSSYTVEATYAYLHLDNAQVGNIDVKFKGGIPGDINNDGVVDGIDLNIMVSILLGHDDADNYDGRADVNENNEIDAVDLNCIINIILGN